MTLMTPSNQCAILTLPFIHLQCTTSLSSSATAPSSSATVYVMLFCFFCFNLSSKAKKNRVKTKTWPIKPILILIAVDVLSKNGIELNNLNNTSRFLRHSVYLTSTPPPSSYWPAGNCSRPTTVCLAPVRAAAQRTCSLTASTRATSTSQRR